MRAHPIYKFEELEVTFCNRYKKIQIDEELYMELQVIKQGMDEKVEVYSKRTLKLINCF
jgi:hypothetical protein